MADAKAPKQGKRKTLHPWVFWCQKTREDLDDATDLLEAAKRRIQQLHPVNSRRLVVKVGSGVKPAVVSMQPLPKVG